MAEPNAGGLDKAKLKQYLVPAVAVAAVVVLVGLVVFMSGDAARSMSDGSNGGVDDSGLKEAAPGVKYRDIKEGVGEPCPPGAEVTMHYTGWLPDGTVFDSSRDRGAPATFQLPNLIKGWQEGIPGMKPGGIRKLVIAPNKGYGAEGSPPKIPPNSTLIFEVELQSFSGGAAAGAGAAAASGAGRPMSDGSNGGTEDAGLRDLGDGLKVRDLKEGTGEPVKPGATVTIHYTGWTLDGNVFDSSKKGGGQPATFELPRLIPGWQKGIPGVKPGGIRKLVVPPDLGYGAKGYPPDIPPNATLVFEVEVK